MHNGYDFTARSGRWEAFPKRLEEKQRKVLCAQKFLLFKMGKFHVPVNQHKYDQTTRDLVKQKAVRSLLKDV